MTALTDTQKKLIFDANRDMVWLRGLSEDSLKRLDTSRKGDSKAVMISRYMVARHGAKAVKLAGIRLHPIW